MKVAIAQLNSSDIISKNLDQIKELAVKAATEKAKIIFLPENSMYFRLQQEEKVIPITLDGPEVSALQKLSDEHGIAIHFTSPIKEGEKVFNGSVLVAPGKVPKAVYRKMHLFDIELLGQKPMRESDSFELGPEPTVFEIDGYKFGSSICYDVRFAELYAFYARQGVDAILVPAAFLVKTGLAHWEVLLRARAIESQCYVLASAQAGLHASSEHSHTRETFGHSMVVDPWGQIVQRLAEGVGLLFYEINKDEIEKVRRQIPMHKHRRKLF